MGSVTFGVLANKYFEVIKEWRMDIVCDYYDKENSIKLGEQVSVIH